MSRFEDEQVATLESELSEEEREMLDSLADGIVSRRLTAAALFFLESMKPLGFVTSQVMHFFRPIIQVVWTSPVRYDQISRVLERRGSIELLLRRLEARA
jgi:hypothetical protein